MKYLFYLVKPKPKSKIVEAASISSNHGINDAKSPGTKGFKIGTTFVRRSLDT